MTRVLNIAHRGARSLAPENTLAAARMARHAGADMWELDVAVSADGALFVMHDDSLQRTTNAALRFPDRAPWTFSGFTLAELEQLDYGSWFSESDPFGEAAAGNITPAAMAAFRGEPLLTLRAALHFTRRHAWQVNVEIKRLPAPLENFPAAAAVVAMVDELGMAEQVVVSSFVFENGPFGSWDRGPNYGILSLMETLRDLEKVPGNNVKEKLQEVTANPKLYPIDGLSALLENIGESDTIKLLTNASPVINKFLENQSKDPMVSMVAVLMGRFSQDFFRPARTLERSKDSRRPSFFTTMGTMPSMRS